MMQFELSKKDKKTAREIIEIGIQKEYVKGLYLFDSILNKWKNKDINNKEAYQLLCRKIESYDTHIAKRYDRITGSNYLYIIASQLIDGVISENDLSNLSEETQNAIKIIAGL